ncbi:hypothetical protein CkaCkLH20_12889 [Colletotrichum karsti]|uniref:Alcohol acetyltransferase FCK4 n=1 Tax=Colletotrichum karsti TaxID=1095194 RepID=A0A9P6LEX4_9PEZI|nr:uncharacterized protein CkaCkLH20_12889 [Colletotrichum karsti]KAF9869702.1 hypothetical protein CkaCkLH20_12889 [Colletotrichum karsti]
MNDTDEFLRYASPNEQRTISREDLGFYHAVIIGAIYQLENGLTIDSPQSLFGPLTHCIEQHPFLSVKVGDRHSEKSFYERAAKINLEKHVEVLEARHASDSERWRAIEELQRANLDRPFDHSGPPWRVIVLHLSRTEKFIAFAWSHALGDGPTGTSFHRSLLKAIRTNLGTTSAAPSVITPPRQPLGMPFDTPERLPISWSFLLGPLIAVLLPTFMANWLGVKAQAVNLDDGTWTGFFAFFDVEKTRTKVLLQTIKAPLVNAALQEAKKHDAKLTGLLHQLIARGMSKAFGGSHITNFVSQTAVNMRKSVGAPTYEMGEFVSARYLVHPKRCSSGPLSDEEWFAASSSTKQFAETAVSLKDQPIGLLRYVPSIRSWLMSKLGQRRDCSHEVSNIGAFEDEEIGNTGKARISHFVFSQPGHVSSAPICFNISSVKHGALVYTVTWPTGALGVKEAEEERMVSLICESINSDFEAFE